MRVEGEPMSEARTAMLREARALKKQRTELECERARLSEALDAVDARLDANPQHRSMMRLHSAPARLVPELNEIYEVRNRSAPA